MQHESSRFQKNSDLPARLRLLQSADCGRLDSIECPQCKQATVAVWYTHPFPREYRTWFVCSNCSFSMRAQNSAKPKHFSRERLDERLQSLDRDGRDPELEQPS